MTGWLTAAAMAGVFTALCMVALGYRRRAIKWHGIALQKNDVILSLRATTANTLAEEARWRQDATDLAVIVKRYEDEAAESQAITDRIAAGVMAKIACVSELPDWFVVGSEHAPIVLDRTYVDGSLSDTAWLSTVDELAGPRTYEGSE